MSSNHHMGVTTPQSGVINHTGYLSEHIGVLYLNTEYSDVILKVDKEIFHSHKVILASRSEYFRALLFGGLKESHENVIELQDTNILALKSLLKYIYTGQMSLGAIKEDAVIDILGLAHQYGFEDLETAICDYLRQSLTVENVCTIYEACCLYQLKNLDKVCKKFIDDQTEEIMNCNAFLQLSSESLKELIQRDSFYALEANIFKAVIKWAEANSLEKTSQFQDLLSAVRFPLMSMGELFSVVRPTGYVPSDIILDALQLQTTSKNSDLPFRGVLKPFKNMADPLLGAEVLQGEMRSALLDGNSSSYDLENGYTRHVIDHQQSGIVIKLDTQAIVNHMRMLLWDRDFRSYSYYIEVSMDQNDWVRVIDHTESYCRSWQFLYFEHRVVKYIRIVGTNNTINKIFHAISFEIMFTSETVTLLNGLLAPQNNVARPSSSACVLEGVCRRRNNLLDGNKTDYDWDSGYTCHQIGSGGILVQLGQPYMLESMRLLLWDCDDRNYSYYIEVSMNMIDWETVWDKSHEYCHSWQLIVFPIRPVVFIRITGTHNTANEIFHCVHFECPAQCDEAIIKSELVKLAHQAPQESVAEDENDLTMVKDLTISPEKEIADV